MNMVYGLTNDPGQNGNGGGQGGGQAPPVQVIPPQTQAAGGGGGGFLHPILSANGIPSFPTITMYFDKFAQRFPWWIWFLLGVGATWYLQKRGYWKRIARAM